MDVFARLIMLYFRVAMREDTSSSVSADNEVPDQSDVMTQNLASIKINPLLESE